MPSTGSETQSKPSLRPTTWLLVAASLAGYWTNAFVARHELLTSSLGIGAGRLLTYLGYSVVAAVAAVSLVAFGHITSKEMGLRPTALDLRPIAAYSVVVVAGSVAWLGGWVLWGASLGPEQLSFARGVMKDIANAGLESSVGTSALAVWTSVIVTKIIGAFTEEVVYRGVLQSTLAARFGSIIAVAASTLVFAAAHVWVYGYSYVGWPWSPIVLGALLGFVFVRHRSLLVVTTIHVVWNMASIVTAAVLAKG